MSAGRLATGFVPTSFAGAVAQVYGQPGTSRFYLMRVARALVFDRTNARVDLFLGKIPVTLRLSVDWSSESPPFVEFQADFLVGLFQVIDTALRQSPDALLNWNPALNGEVGGLFRLDQDTPRTELPGGDNTRAANVGRLVAQALSTATCEEPEPPPGPGEDSRSVNARNVVLAAS